MRESPAGGALKAYLANSPTLTIAGRVRQVHAFFRARSDTQNLVTAAPHTSPWLPEGYVQHFKQPLRLSMKRGGTSTVDRRG